PSTFNFGRVAMPAAAAQWTANGIPVSTGTGNQVLDIAAIASDGSGGAIVTWEDNRSGAYDIYVQHILSSGVVDPAWPAGGLAVCTATGDQLTPALTRDGANGALVTWSDYRGGATSDVYAQHVLGSGVVDPVWPANGVAVCTATDDQQKPTIASDMAGGGVIVWNDHRSGNFDIYAHHVLSSGVDSGWPSNGSVVC